MPSAHPMILPRRARDALSLVALVLLLLLPVRGVAQSANAPRSAGLGSIQGTVTFLDQDKPSPLEGVTIKLSAASGGITPASTITDTAGAYLFSGLPGNTYTLELSESGFQPQTETVVLEGGGVLVRNFSLRLTTANQTVEVREGTSALATENANSTTTVSATQIAGLPIAHPSIMATLPLVPSVVRTADGLLSMKGTSENQGMMLVDSAETVDPVTGNFSIPISLDAIQTVSVSETAYNAEYGGFSGGLTDLHTKPPGDVWHFGLNNFIPGFRGKDGRLYGVQDEEPRLYLTGPLRKGKLNFSEAVTYQFMRPPVRGLPWPYNETITQGAGALTSVEATLSPRHILTLNLNLFFQRVQYADIGALVPQTASSDEGQRGWTLGAVDSYQFASGMTLSTVFQYTRLNTDAEGQGSADMIITPAGWSGNFFNSWARRSDQFQIFPSLQHPVKNWHGRHELKEGVIFGRRSYGGSIQSHPIQLLREDGTLAERIDFQGAGITSGLDTEVSEFIQDHWTMTDRLSVDLGARLVSQTAGRESAFAPRAGLAYSLGKDRKTAIHTGAGLFYDRVPLLATDFTNNPTRVISYYDATGQLMGSPITLENVYLQSASNGGFAVANSDLDRVARNFTWNVELDHEVRRNLDLRISYLQSATRDLPLVLPLAGASGGPSLLGLAYVGSSRYHAVEATLHYQPTDSDELTVSYIHSQARSDLNLLANIYVPFEQAVIRPNVYGISPSDIPDRLVVTGTFALPFHLVLCPVVDIHTGLPYSAVDMLQNYVGAPDAARFPYYFSLDFQVYKEFDVATVPFLGFIKGRTARLGIFSLDVTNRHNPNDVFNNVTSPSFGQFAGLGRRVDGFVFEIH